MTEADEVGFGWLDALATKVLVGPRGASKSIVASTVVSAGRIECLDARANNLEVHVSSEMVFQFKRAKL